jgi:hypothetical protein
MSWCNDAVRRAVCTYDDGQHNVSLKHVQLYEEARHLSVHRAPSL